MSNQAVAWAYDQRIEPSGAKFVLVTLANYASADGYCFPGQDRIALDTCMSTRAVRSHLATLEDLGYLRRQFRYDRNGKRTSDGFWLVGFKPLPADIAASLSDESATSTERLPADSAASKRVTTGKKRHDYRQISTSLPADSAATYKEEPSDEPSGNHQIVNLPSSDSQRARPVRVDLHWDTQVDIFGFSPTPKTPEHGRWQRSTAIWRQLGATPDEMRLAAARYRQEFPDAAFTVLAVAGRAEQLLRGHKPNPPPRTSDIRNPGIRALIETTPEEYDAIRRDVHRKNGRSYGVLGDPRRDMAGGQDSEYDVLPPVVRTE